MISVEDYFAAYPNHADRRPIYRDNAKLLLDRVSHLLVICPAKKRVNPATGTLISGDKNGGWRPQDCPIGAPNSSHKTGEGVDVYDPDGEIDDWLMDNESILVAIDLYIEHPSATRGWCHLTTRAPRSGRRIFYP